MKNLIASSACLAFLMTPVFAQSPLTFPPPPAPAAFWGQLDVTGTVKAFALTPIGEIEGLILTNGIEVHVPPHLTEQLAAAVRPGELVAVRGWNSGVPNFIVATALTGQRGQGIVDQGPPLPGMRPPPPPPGQAPSGAQMAIVQGRVLQILHGPRGDANGAILDDGTTMRLSPPAAWQTGSLLQPGQQVAVQGWSLSNSYGHVVDVQSITSIQQGAAPPAPISPGGAGAAPPPPPAAGTALPPPSASPGMAPPAPPRG